MRAALTSALLLAACSVESPFPPADLAPLEAEPGFAAVTSDYESTAIAILAPDGALITEAWVDSGTTEPGIAAALSGDVVLPTDPVPGELVLLDRFGVDVVTRIALPDGAVIGQLPTQLDRDHSPSGFRANPHDVVFLADGRVVVSRYDRNPNGGAPPLDAGNDLVVVDAASGTLEHRVAMDAADVPHEDGTRWARPDRMARVGDRLVVGLGRMSTQWEAATGAIAVVDPNATAPTVEVTVLEGLAACGLVRAVPGDGQRVAVLCSGDPFEPGTLDESSLARRRMRAGLATLRIDATGAAAVEHLWRAAEHPDGPVPTSALAALGEARVAFAAWGDPGAERPDRLFVADLATGAMRLAFETEPFAVGSGAYDTDTGVLVLPDAAVGVRRVRIEADLSTAELPAIDPSPGRNLPPREIARLVSP